MAPSTESKDDHEDFEMVREETNVLDESAKELQSIITGQLERLTRILDDGILLTESNLKQTVIDLCEGQKQAHANLLQVGGPVPLITLIPSLLLQKSLAEEIAAKQQLEGDLDREKAKNELREEITQLTKALEKAEEEKQAAQAQGKSLDEELKGHLQSVTEAETENAKKRENAKEQLLELAIALKKAHAEKQAAEGATEALQQQLEEEAKKQKNAKELTEKQLRELATALKKAHAETQAAEAATKVLQQQLKDEAEEEAEKAKKREAADAKLKAEFRRLTGSLKNRETEDATKALRQELEEQAEEEAEKAKKREELTEKQLRELTTALQKAQEERQAAEVASNKIEHREKKLDSSVKMLQESLKERTLLQDLVKRYDALLPQLDAQATKKMSDLCSRCSRTRLKPGAPPPLHHAGDVEGMDYRTTFSRTCRLFAPVIHRTSTKPERELPDCWLTQATNVEEPCSRWVRLIANNGRAEQRYRLGCRTAEATSVTEIKAIEDSFTPLSDDWLVPEQLDFSTSRTNSPASRGSGLPFLVVLAADPVMLRRDLKLIVTSATMNAEKICVCTCSRSADYRRSGHRILCGRPSQRDCMLAELELSRIQNTESTAETPPAEHDPHGRVLKMTVKRDWTDESLSTMDEFSSLLNFELPCRSLFATPLSCSGRPPRRSTLLIDIFKSSGGTTTSATIDGLMGGLGEKNADAIAAINKSYELEADFTNEVIKPVVVNGDDGRIKVGSLFANTTSTPMTLEGSRSKWTALWLVPSDDTHCSLQMLLDNHPLCATYETTETNPQPLTMTECGKTNGQIFGYDDGRVTVYGRDDDDSAYEERRDTQQSYPHLPRWCAWRRQTGKPCAGNDGTSAIEQPS
ncbi:hypothetical protein C8F01DRAFT_1082904 [Mycena amicta]|nr:hypothetical protein C8F01DRAFT_1082904 [Mycena amicta]